MPVRTQLFLSHGTQSVPLPGTAAFDPSVTEVEIEVVGDARVVRPAGSRVATFWASDLQISDDFGRDQPATAQDRSAASSGSVPSAVRPPPA